MCQESNGALLYVTKERVKIQHSLCYHYHQVIWAILNWGKTKFRKAFGSHLVYLTMKQFVHFIDAIITLANPVPHHLVLLCPLSRQSSILTIIWLVHFCHMCHDVARLAIRISSLIVSSIWREKDTHLEGFTSIIKFQYAKNFKPLKGVDSQQSTTGVFMQDYSIIRDYLTGSFFTVYSKVWYSL